METRIAGHFLTHLEIKAQTSASTVKAAIYLHSFCI